ncbi:glycosyltransferase family protein [Hyphomicrobium sp.]|uniref:glycosyltransferase family protein n=1 Tax=Hyphomicrobium sp. TaxID=82 RepID=UPI0025B800CF|nr:glycosyltransferase family protein [Hyphomicrobium sp.]MCC7250955.1 glycosyltransferase family protein [Hyphomicrobium sp.]
MTDRVVAIVQARTSSSRLPGKVLKDLIGVPMIVQQLDRLGRTRLVDRLVVATSDDPSDDELVGLLVARAQDVVRGALDDVLGRFTEAMRTFPSEHVVRLTADCPLADPDVVDAVVAYHLLGGSAITTNSVESRMPDGLDVEVIRSSALLTAAEEATKLFEREHVTQFLYRRPDRFGVCHFPVLEDLGHLRWTVDEPADLDFVRAVYSKLYPANPQFGFRDVLRLLEREPELARINSGIARNEGLACSLEREQTRD